jgi:Tfp pilus assembly protein PilO
MNKLSKDKRDKLILTILLVVGILGALYTYVLAVQKERLGAIQQQIETVRDKVTKADKLIKNEALVARNLAESQRALERRIDDMAPQVQTHYWLLILLDGFRKQEKLGTDFISEISPPEIIEVGLLPKFPFKAASFAVRVNGRFHDIGRFIADLENSFPYFRVQNVRMNPQLQPTGNSQNSPDASGEGKLLVELRLVSLLKPGST